MRGKSLLSVGIRSVEGDFGLDDIVDVADETGHVFARGRAAAASDLLKLACGRSREEVASPTPFWPCWPTAPSSIATNWFYSNRRGP